MTVTVYKIMEQSVLFGFHVNFTFYTKSLNSWKNQKKSLLFFLIHVFLNVNSVFCSGGIMMSDDDDDNNCNYSYSTAIYGISTGSGVVTLIRRRL